MKPATKPQAPKPQLIDSMGWEAGLEMHFQGTTAKGFESVTIKDAMSDLQNDIDDLEATMAALESFPEAVLDLPVLAIDFGHYGVSKTERKQIDNPWLHAVVETKVESKVERYGNGPRHPQRNFGAHRSWLPTVVASD
jgi:hypothetical protein